MSTAFDFGNMPCFRQVHHSTKGGSSVSKHISSSMHRHCSIPASSDSELQLLKQLYMTLLRALRRQYLEDLLEMQALCTLLCGIHSSAQTQMRRLQQLNDRHLRPIIAQLQEPKAQLMKRQIQRRDVDRLIRLKELMAPFVHDFSQTAHALRRQAFQARPFYNTVKHAAAAAA